MWEKITHREATKEEITDLVIQAQAGDTGVHGDLYEIMYAPVYSAIRRRVHNHATAEDLVQDVFIIAFKNLHQLDKPGAFQSWICKIAYHESVNYLTRGVAKYTFADIDALGETSDDTTQTPVEQLIAGEREVCVQQVLQELKPLDSGSLVLFHQDDLSLIELSEEDLGETGDTEPLGTVKRRLHVARKRFKDAYLKRWEGYE